MSKADHRVALVIGALGVASALFGKKKYCPVSVGKGEHGHLCAQCGHRWRHTATAKGNVAAHRCAVCKTISKWAEGAGPTAAGAAPP